jgi:AcrR family transcriptional regulator
MLEAAPGWRQYEPFAIEPPLDAVLDAFVEFGYHGATIRKIAKCAGLSVPGIYHHWSSKQQMLVTLLDLSVSDLLRRSRQARLEGGDPIERLSHLVECLALYHVYRKDLASIGATEMRGLDGVNRKRIVALRVEQQRMFDEEILDGCRLEVFTTQRPHDASRAIVTMCTSLPQWYSSVGQSAPEAIAADYVTFALNLVGGQGNAIGELPRTFDHQDSAAVSSRPGDLGRTSYDADAAAGTDDGSQLKERS